MTGGSEHEAQTVAEAESPVEFLAKLGNALREKENVDVGLVDILAKHLLTAAPAVDAIVKAKDAILELAAERANPPKPEASNG